MRGKNRLTVPSSEVVANLMNRAKWSNVEFLAIVKTILYQQNTKVLRKVSGRYDYISTERMIIYPNMLLSVF